MAAVTMSPPSPVSERYVIVDGDVMKELLCLRS